MAEPLIREWTVEEILELIDERARFHLGISGDEFMRRYREGKLKYTSTEMSVIGLASLIEPEPKPRRRRSSRRR